MALSKKATVLLNKIFNHHKRDGQKLVKADPDEALEYLLQEIVDRLTDPRHSDSSPLYRVTDDAVGSLSIDHWQRREAEKEAAAAKKQLSPRKTRKATSA